MVPIETIEKKLDELSEFFDSVKRSSSVSNIDRQSAMYGFNKVEFMRKTLHQYEKKPADISLKRIHSAFFSVTRGIEAFSDKETNEMFHKKCNGIFEIIKDLEERIKW